MYFQHFINWELLTWGVLVLHKLQVNSQKLGVQIWRIWNWMLPGKISLHTPLKGETLYSEMLLNFQQSVFIG